MVSGVAVANDAAGFAFGDNRAASEDEATAVSSSSRVMELAPVRKMKVFGTCVAAMSLWAACAGGMLIELVSSGFGRVGEVDPDLET
jgi:hypothetical protein